MDEIKGITTFVCMSKIYIHTDACFNRQYKEATYSFVVQNNFRIFSTSGILEKNLVKNITEAELYSIFEAVSYCDRIDLFSNIEEVVVHTDCKTLLNVFENGATTNNMMYGSMMSVKRMVSPAKMDLKHVKSHTTRVVDKFRSLPPQVYFNHMCDYNAKLMMRKAIGLQKEKLKI